MCTAISYKTHDHYFGRNLDLDYSYNETVTVMPRKYLLSFKNSQNFTSHYAMIGMAYVQNGYPLYYDAVNEKGLAVAGLSFGGNCVYCDAMKEKDNIASFELIPWVLCQCGTVNEAKKLLEKMNITNDKFSAKLLPTPQHWLVADGNSSIVIEQTENGIKIYDNPTGVLTNNPTFDIQLFNLNNYMNLSSSVAENRFSEKLDLKTYSRGMGSMGLPGDLSSMSRFVKAVFVKENSVSDSGEDESVSQLFHILDSVKKQRGCVNLGDGKYEITVYSSCCNTQKGIYYYKTYENSRINAVDMNKEKLDTSKIISYKVINKQDIHFCN